MSDDASHDASEEAIRARELLDKHDLLLGRRSYVLDDDGNPVAEPNIGTWSAWMAANFERLQTIANTQVSERVRVHTTFFGVDLARPWQAGPLCFETMILGGKHDGSLTRTRTHAEAVAAHSEAVAKVLAGRAIQ